MKQQDDVLIEDEFLRDGLQNEAVVFSVDEKVRIAELLADCGLRRIQVGSFVNPKRVPQMADTEEVLSRLGERPGAVLSALVLNGRGVERAMAAGVRHLSMSVSASPEHSRRNLNQEIDEALARIEGMIEAALDAGIEVRAGIQCAFGSPWDDVETDSVVALARTYGEAGIREINLADTAGMANPVSLRRLVRRVEDAAGPAVAVSLHLHDTRGLGLANLVAGFEAGVRVFDTALGGTGGCPFIPRAAGNVATEDAVHALEAMGAKTGIDWRGLCGLTIDIEERLGRRLPGHLAHLTREAA